MGATGSAGTNPQLVFTTTGVLARPAQNTIIAQAAECPPGLAALGGGVRVFTTPPDEIVKVHMLESGPGDDGISWVMRSVLTQRFALNSTLEVRVFAICN